MLLAITLQFAAVVKAVAFEAFPTEKVAAFVSLDTVVTSTWTNKICELAGITAIFVFAEAPVIAISLPCPSVT